MEQSQRNPRMSLREIVVAEFIPASPVGDKPRPYGISHAVSRGETEQALARGTEWMSLRRVVTLSEAKGLDIRDSSPTVQNDKRDKAISSQQGQPDMRRALNASS